MSYTYDFETQMICDKSLSQAKCLILGQTIFEVIIKWKLANKTMESLSLNMDPNICQKLKIKCITVKAVQIVSIFHVE